MKGMEKTLKALANRRRLGILRYLKKHREASVKEIAGVIKLSIKSTSRHLSILANADILEHEQRQLFVFYRIAPNQNQTVKSIIATL